MIWQPEFTDKTLSRKPGAVQSNPPDSGKQSLHRIIARLWRKQHDTGTGTVLEPCFQGVPDMWFFSTVLFLLIVICSVAGVVNALAVRRELHARREQEYHARGRTATGERILRERYEKFRRRRQH
ncbi:TPA: hypothetical protein ACH7CB_005648, partial [Escherichia coli]